MVTEAEARIDHYSVLGIRSSAEYDEIKRTYKSLALKWHPDKNPDNPHAHGMFQQVSAAYEILSDTSRRADYDRARQTYGFKSGYSTSYGTKSNNNYTSGNAPSASKAGDGASTWSSPRAKSAYSGNKSYTSYGYSSYTSDSWNDTGNSRRSKSNYFQEQYRPKSSRAKSSDSSTGNKPKTNTSNTKPDSDNGQPNAKSTRPNASNSNNNSKPTSSQSSKPPPAQAPRPSPAQQRNTKSYSHPISSNEKPIQESDGRKRTTSEEQVPKPSRPQEQAKPSAEKASQKPATPHAEKPSCQDKKATNEACPNIPNGYTFNFTSPVTPENEAKSTGRTPFTVNGMKFSFGAFKEAMDASPSKKSAPNLNTPSRRDRSAQGSTRLFAIPRPVKRPDKSTDNKAENKSTNDAQSDKFSKNGSNSSDKSFNARAWSAAFSTGNPLMNGLASDPKDKPADNTFGKDEEKLFAQDHSSPRKNTQDGSSKETESFDHLKFDGFKFVTPLSQTFGDFNLKDMKKTVREEFLSGEQSGARPRSQDSKQSPTREAREEGEDKEESLPPSKSQSIPGEDDKDEDEKEKEEENKKRSEEYSQFSKRPVPSNNKTSEVPFPTQPSGSESGGGGSRVIDLHDSNIILSILPPIVPTLPDSSNLKTDAETLKNLERQILEYQALWNDYDAKVTQYHHERQAANLLHSIDILSDVTNLSRYIDATYLDERVRREWASALAVHRQFMSQFLTLRRVIDSLR